jgi:polysaccharide export outer membrane protein
MAGSMAVRARNVLTVLGLVLFPVACAGTRTVQESPAPMPQAHPVSGSDADSVALRFLSRAASQGRLIVPRDLLDVTVFEAPELSRAVRVSDVGTISLPLLGQIQAAGRTPRDLEVVLQDTLRRTYMRDPRVTVEVKEAAAQPVYVVGEVTQPGAFTPSGEDRLTVLRAIAVARGLKPTAAQGRAIIIRPRAGGEPLQMRVNLNEVVKGKIPDPVLLPNDVVYVPKNAERAVALGLVDALVRVVTFRAAF